MKALDALETDSKGNLTKRGKMAAKFLGSLREVAVENLQVGSTVRQNINFSPETAYFRVEWCEPRNGVFTVLVNHSKFGRKTLVLETGSKLRLGWPPEVKAQQLAAAIAYQNSLNAWGKPNRKAARQAQEALQLRAE